MQRCGLREEWIKATEEGRELWSGEGLERDRERKRSTWGGVYMEIVSPKPLALENKKGRVS